jgi:acyl-CoA dehydrogenase family protein 9
MSDPKNPAVKSFGKSLFFGHIHQELVFPYPRMSRGEHEQVQALLAALHRFAAGTPGIDPRRIDDEGRIPKEVLAGLAGLSLFGLSVPTAYGGLGLSYSAAGRVLQEVAGLDASIALTLESHLSLCCRAINLFGTEEQKRRYLPRLARGEALAAFCRTEPLSGSDAAAIRSRAEPRDGGYLLNGTKLWVTNGALAEVFIVFAQTEVLREGARADRITGFLVERGPGVRSGAEERRLGARGASVTALYLDNVRVPKDAVLGQLGGGFRVAMEVLNAGRLTLSAGCVGRARELVRLSVQHATSRRQFGRLISSFGMIKDKVATMMIDLYAAESMVYLTCGLLDQNDRRGSKPADYSVESACCKVFCSEMQWRVANEAARIAAGHAYVHDYPYERLLRESYLPLFFEGTNEVLRCYIALTGLQGPGEQLAKLADAIKFPLRGYGLVMDTLMDKVKVAAYGGAPVTEHHPLLKKEAVHIEDAVEALQKGVDRVLRRHGSQISEMQYVQRRVADVVIDVYGMIACVSRASSALFQHDRRRASGQGGVEHAGEIDTAERELRLCRGFCIRAAERIRLTLLHFNDNDDELMKNIADDAYQGRPYPFDSAL